MFEVTREGESFKIYFSATLKNVDKAGRETRHFLKSIGRENCIFEVLLLMREALNNAVQKGCKQDIKKTVHYSIDLENESLIMKVEDDGDGFDWKKYMGRKQVPESDHGRGLQIMKKYSNEINYNKTGNSLSIIKHLTGCNK